MLKKIAWNTFKNTGNIDTYLELTQVKDIERNVTKVNENGKFESEGYNNFRK